MTTGRRARAMHSSLPLHKILYAFEVAERLTDPAQRRAWLTFVIVGAGPTGVELAGAIGEIARQTLKRDFRSIHPEDGSVFVLHWEEVRRSVRVDLYIGHSA